MRWWTSRDAGHAAGRKRIAPHSHAIRRARWLVIWRDRTKLYEECIPAPPAVSLDCNVSASDESYRLDWAASTLDPCDIWYLVQWEDLDGTW